MFGEAIPDVYVPSTPPKPQYIKDAESGKFIYQQLTGRNTGMTHGDAKWVTSEMGCFNGGLAEGQYEWNASKNHYTLTMTQYGTISN